MPRLATAWWSFGIRELELAALWHTWTKKREILGRTSFDRFSSLPLLVTLTLHYARYVPVSSKKYTQRTMFWIWMEKNIHNHKAEPKIWIITMCNTLFCLEDGKSSGLFQNLHLSIRRTGVENEIQTVKKDLVPLGWVCILMCVQGSWVGVGLLLRSLTAANFLTGEPHGDASDGDEETPRDVTSVTLAERLGLYWTTPGEWSIATPLLPWTDGGTCTFRGRRFSYFRTAPFMYNFSNKLWLN